MRKTTALFLGLLLLFASLSPAFAREEPGVFSAVVGGLEKNIWVSKYGNVYTDCSAQQLTEEWGFVWGDVLLLSFLGQELELPLVPTYSYVESGKPALILKKGTDGMPEGNLYCAINMGSFAETYGLAVKKTDAEGDWYFEAAEGVSYPLELRISLLEKDGYREEYLLQDIQRTNLREDYPGLSDADFANFRPIAAPGIQEGILYRMSSPIDPSIGRNSYADAALEAAGVSVILNLADDAETARSYPGFSESYYSKQKVIYLNLGMDFHEAKFRSSLADGLRFLAENEGIYALHCTEGKDRAGFVSALLACLMGASAEEVIHDYMQSYVNYYAVEIGSEKYNTIARRNIIAALSEALGLESLDGADLSEAAKAYLLGIGLGETEIQNLKARLSGEEIPAVPESGSAGSGYVLLFFVPLAVNLISRKKRV